MAQKLSGANDHEKLKDLATKTYKAQAVWFLNSFWDQHQGEAERLWNWVHKLQTLDIQKGKDGNEVDELKAHVLLEFFKETMTVREMRDNLKETGAITGVVKMVPLIHLLIYRYRSDWHYLVNAPQGSNQKEIEEAQRLLEAVLAAFAEAESKAKASRAALKEAEAREAEAKAAEAKAKQAEADAKAAAAAAKSREDEAKKSEQTAREREAELKAAQEELTAALNELKTQEDAYNNRTNELRRVSEDESVGLVTRNKTKNELAQHLAQDPLPLRKAKITQEAAVKKADKASQVAEAARQSAEQNRVAAEKARQAADAAAREAEKQARDASNARQAAEKAREASARAKEAADAAMEAARVKVDEAEAYLAEVKSRPGNAYGALWWIERELHEAKAFMPERKGGYKKGSTDTKA